MTKPRPYGQYYILEKIAQGGMAEIYKGLTYDFSGLKKFIVIKKILPHISANEEFVQMLVEEAKIAVRMNHGNVAQTMDLGKVAQDYFIVMEYVPGKTLSEIYKKSFRQGNLIPIPYINYIIGEISNGLDYIHRRADEKGRPLGIIHCDISPQNIIVSESGTVKIVDFGVAKVAYNIREQEQGALKGKFAYMSPEQLGGNKIDFRSDLFSVGVVLWEGLTGKRLFKKKSKGETVESVKSMVIPPPSTFRSDIPPELDSLTLKILERNPKKRYASASEISVELTKINLKYFPEFKPTIIGSLLKELFEGDNDVLENLEHTQIDTVPNWDKNFDKAEVTQDLIEETVIVDPKELNFHSVFEELDFEDISEVTKSIRIEELEDNIPPKKSRDVEIIPQPLMLEQSMVTDENKGFEELNDIQENKLKNLKLWVVLILGLASMFLFSYIFLNYFSE